MDLDQFVVNQEYKPYKITDSKTYSWQIINEELQEVNSNDENGVLKITTNSHDEISYFLKKGPLNQFYNPWGMYNHGKNSLKYKDQYGRTWNWTKVPKEAFDQYILFLKTKNTTRYTAATRLYLYGGTDEKR